MPFGSRGGAPQSRGGPAVVGQSEMGEAGGVVDPATQRPQSQRSSKL